MILAMDGGGSKTRLLLSDAQGRIQAEQILEGCNYLQVGFGNLEKTIAEGLAEICRQAEISSDELQFAVLGIPAYGEIQADSQTIDAIVAKLLTVPYAVVNDVKLAWAGSLACQPGIAILSGTGSMAFGVDAQGRDWRSGGWGHYFGDEGSAFWLGKKCCQLFSKMADSRAAKGPLYQMVRDEFQLVDDFEILDIVANMADCRKQTAAIAKLLYRAASSGDRLAQEVFAEAGAELASMAMAISSTFLQGTEELHVSYAGGTFACGELLLRPLWNCLQNLLQSKRLRFTAPLLEPALGACLYGAIQLGWHRKDYADKLASYQQDK